jgi:hypothetical protein
MTENIDPRKIDPDVNYTLEQIADFLHLSYSTVLKFKKEGHFKDFKKIGRRYYVPGKTIISFIQNATIEKS